MGQLPTHHSVTAYCRAVFRVFEDICTVAVATRGLGVAGGGDRFGVISSCVIVIELFSRIEGLFGREVCMQVWGCLSS
jgi:hypothetical protein